MDPLRLSHMDLTGAVVGESRTVDHDSLLGQYGAMLALQVSGCFFPVSKKDFGPDAKAIIHLDDKLSIKVSVCPVIRTQGTEAVLVIPRLV